MEMMAVEIHEEIDGQMIDRVDRQMQEGRQVDRVTNGVHSQLKRVRENGKYRSHYHSEYTLMRFT